MLKMAIFVTNGPVFDNYGSRFSNSGQHFGPSVGCYCVYSALNSHKDTVSDCVLCSPISLTCCVATGKVKGQGHPKTKVKVTKKTMKNAFWLNFHGNFFTHAAYSGSCHS